MKHYSYSHNRRRGRVPARVWWILGTLLIVLLASVIYVRHLYTSDLQPVSNNKKRKINSKFLI